MEDKKRFDIIFEYLLYVEGGYTDDKYDNGGKTTWGITEKEARQHGYKGHMKDFNINVAKAIYRSDYYDKFRLSEIKSDKIALSVCDFCVNAGYKGITKTQVALNKLGYDLKVDGVIGKNTINALNSVNEDLFLPLYHKLQKEFYEAIVSYNPSQRKFLEGWYNRIKKKEEKLKTIFN